jgi:hypothetical protein
LPIDPDVLKQAEQISRVLSPIAWRKRDKIDAAGGRFAHYTTAAAALSIIKSKSIWMRNATCMADYSEVQHGFKKLNAQAGFKLLTDILDQELAGAGKEALNLFNQWWGDTQLETYIASISEHDAHEDTHGRLSMWRAFGGGQIGRVAFVLKIPSSPPVGALLNLWVSPVEYFSDDELANELRALSSNVQAKIDVLKQAPRPMLIGAVFAMLVAGIVCLKHEGFLEEREWRIVHNPKRASTPLMRSDVEIMNGIPQLVFKIPIGGGPPNELDALRLENLLDRIIIGPTPYPWAMYQAFVTALTDAGVPDAGSKVFVSGIPIRS